MPLDPNLSSLLFFPMGGVSFLPRLNGPGGGLGDQKVTPPSAHLHTF
jgi:hypothetical protein